MGILWTDEPLRLLTESPTTRVITTDLPGGDFLGRAFATSVFGGDLEHVEGGRWFTREAAERGHEAVCERVLGELERRTGAVILDAPWLVR
jgi:hypothetical protein